MHISNRPVQPQSLFRLDGYCVWDPSLVKDVENRYHLFFSRWPLSAGFEAWVTHSEICRASAETPLGPFRFEEVIFSGRPDRWDGDVTHNPTVMHNSDRYYMYYMGNHGNGEWWNHRNNQRIGVAVADSPAGPWRQSDTPLLDVTPGAWDARVVTNPCCTRAHNGTYLLMYKGVGDAGPAPKYGPVLHGVSFSESPEGPFTKHPHPIFATENNDFPGEDPFVWCRDGRYYALLKDMGTSYSASSRAIVLFESPDGINWEIAANPIVQERELIMADNSRMPVNRLERPFIFREDGEPTVFFCAVKPHQQSDASLIVAMGIETL